MTSLRTALARRRERALATAPTRESAHEIVALAAHR
jgi:hypothetical protein